MPIVPYALSQGLPPSLPLDYLRTQQFIQFQEKKEAISSPFGFFFEIDGEKVNDPSQIAALFKNRFLASLPKGTKIAVGRDGQGREIWDYPVGAEVVHLISFATNPERVFELRILRKLPNLSWAYATYSPLNGQGQGTLYLNQYGNRFKSTYQLQLATGKPVTLSLERINLNACQQCHSATSPSAYQYPDLPRTGPCGFAPHNPWIKSTWADAYLKLRSERPF